MTLSTFAIERWLMDTLSADTALAGLVHARLIPAGAALPRCVFEPVSNLDVASANGTSILNRALYLVKVVGRGDGIGALKTMADAVYARLHQKSGTNADGEVWSCTRDEEIALPPDVINGVAYHTLAQRFRVEGKGV